MLSYRSLATLLAMGWTSVLFAQIPGANLLTNGDFQAGNTGFTSSYTYHDPATTTPYTIYDPGTYTIAPNLLTPYPLHPSQALPNYYDHTLGTPSGLFMVMNGSTLANQPIWSTSLTVVPYSFYDFSMWASVWNNDNDNLPRIQVSFNGTPAMVGIPTTPLGTWTNFTAMWFSGSSSSVTITLQGNNLDYVGNDYGLDDLSFVFVSTAVPEPGVLMLMIVTVLACGGYWVYHRWLKRRQPSPHIST